MVVSSILNFYRGLEILKIKKICTNISVAGHLLKPLLDFLCIFKLSNHYHILHLNINGLKNNWKCLQLHHAGHTSQTASNLSFVLKSVGKNSKEKRKDSERSVSARVYVGSACITFFPTDFGAKRKTAWSVLPSSSFE